MTRSATPAQPHVTSREGPAGAGRGDPVTVLVKPHRYGEWISGAVLLLLVVWAVQSPINNPAFQWDIVRQYLFAQPILNGLKVTLYLTVVAMALAIALGMLLAVMRLSSNRILVAISWFYAWFFRATPVLVQLLFLYNLGALYPRLSISLPFGPELVGAPANTVITAWSAAVLGLGLHEAAYMAEIIRSGILSVDRGQREAATALGMTRSRTFFRIVLPQALRVIIPPTGSQVIGMLKMTSLVSILTLADILFAAEAIYARNFQAIPLLIVVVLWYLFLTTLLMIGQYFLERWSSRSDRGGAASQETVAVQPELSTKLRVSDDG